MPGADQQHGAGGRVRAHSEIAGGADRGRLCLDAVARLAARQDPFFLAQRDPAPQAPAERIPARSCLDDDATDGRSQSIDSSARHDRLDRARSPVVCNRLSALGLRRSLNRDAAEAVQGRAGRLPVPPRAPALRAADLKLREKIKNSGERAAARDDKGVSEVNGRFRSAADREAVGYRRRWARILPNVFIVYTISYLDRVNVGTALPAISQDLHLSPTEAGFIGGVFFWGYLVSFLAGGWLANRFGAKRVTLFCLIAWGFFAIAGGFTTNFYELVATRVLLGLSEGPIWSSVSALLSQWFLKSERGRAFGIWNISIPIGALLAGPLSGLVLTYSNWHVMLMLEGLPAWIWALVWWRTIPDSPQSATWLKTEERQVLLGGLAAEQAEFDATVGAIDWWGMIVHPGVWLLLVAKTFNNMVEYGFTLWLPAGNQERTALPR